MILIIGNSISKVSLCGAETTKVLFNPSHIHLFQYKVLISVDIAGTFDLKIKHVVMNTMAVILITLQYASSR